MLLPDTSFSLNVLLMIRDVLLQVVELWGILFQITLFLNLQVPGVLILLWIGWYSTQPIDIHAPKSAVNTFICGCDFFMSHLHIICAHYFVKLPPFRNSSPGSHGTHSSPFPTTERAFVLIPRKKYSELSFLPWHPLASKLCAFMQPTSIIRSTQAARRFLRSVCIPMLLFQA